jgi:hypothetical protein
MRGDRRVVRRKQFPPAPRMRVLHPRETLEDVPPPVVALGARKPPINHAASISSR